MSEAYPSVDVVCWTDRDLWVRCPYCEDLHRHSFVSYESEMRVSHCGPRRSAGFRLASYKYVFPDAYEIDKAGARFVNISTRRELEGSEDTGSFCGAFSRMGLSNTTAVQHQSSVSFDDSTETVVTQLDGLETFEERCIDIAVSDCVNGYVSEIKHYLETSADKSTFLHGKDHDGDTCLIMASREESSSMVSLLLEYGAEVNATNGEGRTALMEASFWGRLESINILLSKGADKRLRDNRNRTALELTQPTPKNQKERHVKAGGCSGYRPKGPLYKEDVYNRDIDRREIARTLGEGNPHVTAENRQPVSEVNDHSFRRLSDDQSIIHCGPIKEYSTSRGGKTISILERGKPFPDIAAMSGWGHSEWPSIDVSGRDWAQKVFELADVVGHTLSVNQGYDHGTPGHYQASHAEKQLIAYFVNRHVFLPADRAPNPRFNEKIECLLSEIAAIADNCPAVSQLYKLEDEKGELEKELFSKDDRALGDEYDEDLVSHLKMKIASLDKRIGSLEMRSEVKKVRAQELQIKAHEDERDLHDQLNRLSEMAPKSALREAAIFISSPPSCRKICDDCMLFKNRVNGMLGLSIKLYERTK